VFLFAITWILLFVVFCIWILKYEISKEAIKQNFSLIRQARKNVKESLRPKKAFLFSLFFLLLTFFWESFLWSLLNVEGFWGQFRYIFLGFSILIFFSSMRLTQQWKKIYWHVLFFILFASLFLNCFLTGFVVLVWSFPRYVIYSRLSSFEDSSDAVRL